MEGNFGFGKHWRMIKICQIFPSDFNFKNFKQQPAYGHHDVNI